LTHDHYKGAQEVVLEGVVGQLVSFQKLHGQLAQALNLCKQTLNAVQANQTVHLQLKE
jgi:hypothetical protein